MIQVSGWDPLRDDGLIYAKLLQRAGTEVRVQVWKGQPHGHWVGMPEFEGAKTAFRDTVEGIGWLIGARE